MFGKPKRDTFMACSSSEDHFRPLSCSEFVTRRFEEQMANAAVFGCAAASVRDIFVAVQGLLQEKRFRTLMTLKSALQDLRETTLAAVRGALAKLAYLGSLRREQTNYQHWGLSQVHGAESSERALRTAHNEVLAEVLRTPLPSLVEDLRESSAISGTPAGVYAEELRGKLEQLLPEEQKNSPAATHLNSVLMALSSLEKNEKTKKIQGRATRST